MAAPVVSIDANSFAVVVGDRNILHPGTIVDEGACIAGCFTTSDRMVQSFGRHILLGSVQNFEHP